MAGFSDFMFGTPGHTMQTQNYTGAQQNAMNGSLQQAMSGLGLNGGMQGGMNPIEQQYTRNFAQNTVPGLAERFTSMGQGGQHSSAFQGALGQAGAGMNEDLAALRQSHLMNLLNIGLKPQFDTSYVPRQGGMLEALAGEGGKAVMGAFGQAGGQYLGNKAFGSMGQMGGGLPSGINPMKLQQVMKQYPALAQMLQ